MEIEKPEMCDCEQNPAKPEHACPYKVELGGSMETCNCCDECRYQCAMDV